MSKPVRLGEIVNGLMADLIEHGTLPDFAERIADSVCAAKNHFFAWSLLLRQTQLPPRRCKQLLEKHGLYPAGDSKP